MTSQRKQHLRSLVFQPEKRWKPVEGVRPGKDWVVNHQEESIGERYFSIRHQVGRFAQEVKALWFLNRKARRRTSHVECWQWWTRRRNITSYQTTHFQLFLRIYRYRIAVPGMVGGSSHWPLLWKSPVLQMFVSGARPGRRICVRCYNTSRMT